VKSIHKQTDSMKFSIHSLITIATLAQISPIRSTGINTIEQQRIVGGSAVGTKDYPFFASPNRGGMCGATAIHNDILVTAAHCGTELWSSGIWVGGNNVNRRSSKYYDVVTTLIHPSYNPMTNENDIALIKIAGSIPPPYAKLNFNSSLPVVGQELTAIGYGATSEGGRLAKILQKVNFYAVSYEECKQTYEDELVDSLMVCNGGIPQGGKDTCQGDSGGPIFIANTTTQIGIVSFGYGCARAATPSINARVSAFEGFIHEYICRLSENRPTSCPVTNAPVAAPTIAPTFEPTPEPSPAPTKAPTKKPTKSPLRVPVMTMAPKKPVAIKAPVKAPTKAPAATIISTLATRAHLVCKPAGSTCLTKEDCCGRNASCQGFPFRTCV
jgi:trypsin